MATEKSAYKTYEVHYWVHRVGHGGDQDYWVDIRARDIDSAREQVKEILKRKGSNPKMWDDYTIRETTVVEKAVRKIGDKAVEAAVSFIKGKPNGRSHSAPARAPKRAAKHSTRPHTTRTTKRVTRRTEPSRKPVRAPFDDWEDPFEGREFSGPDFGEGPYGGREFG